MGDICVNPLPTLAFDPLLQMRVWPQKPIFKGFYQKHNVFPENTMFSENREKTGCFSQGTTFLQVLEALGSHQNSGDAVHIDCGSYRPLNCFSLPDFPNIIFLLLSILKVNNKFGLVVGSIYSGRET